MDDEKIQPEEHPESDLQDDAASPEPQAEGVGTKPDVNRREAKLVQGLDKLVIGAERQGHDEAAAPGSAPS